MTLKYRNQTETSILEALGKFKYLCTSQMIELNIQKDRRYLVTPLKNLREGKRPLINRTDLGTLPGIGRLEQVWYLTKWGGRYLNEELGIDESRIKLPLGETLFIRDYNHRRNTIDMEIAFRNWLDVEGYELIFFNRYFDCVGSNRSAKASARLEALTKIPVNDNFIIADSIGFFETSDSRHLFVLEVHNGNDSGRLTKQLRDKYLKILANGVLSEHHNHSKNCKIACVFEKESCLSAVITRLQADKDFSSFNKLFLFKTIEDAKQGFQKSWKLISGEYVNFI